MKISKTARLTAAAVISLALLVLPLGCTAVATSAYAGQTITVKVTSFDGETVVAEIGELSETSAGTQNGYAPDSTQGSMPDTSGVLSGGQDSMPAVSGQGPNTQTSSPEIPSDTSVPQIPSDFSIPSGVSIPENAGTDWTIGASGSWPSGATNFMPGNQTTATATFTSSGETITFKIDSNTAIVGDNSGSASFTTSSEITIGTVLLVSFNSSGSVNAVIVKDASDITDASSAESIPAETNSESSPAVSG